MKGLVRIMVGGGQDYWGPTSDRDRQVVSLTAQTLFSAIGNTVEIVTGGMPGIPNDFAKAWADAGGKYILCVVSSEHLETYLKTADPRFGYTVIGESQTARRLALTKLDGIKCALFIQGGQYTTHEMQLFEAAGVPIVTFWGSGGAAGGGQPYQGYTYTKKPKNAFICSTDPKEQVVPIAGELVAEVTRALRE